MFSVLVSELITQEQIGGNFQSELQNT